MDNKAWVDLIFSRVNEVLDYPHYLLLNERVTHILSDEETTQLFSGAKKFHEWLNNVRYERKLTLEGGTDNQMDYLQFRTEIMELYGISNMVLAVKAQQMKKMTQVNNVMTLLRAYASSTRHYSSHYSSSFNFTLYYMTGMHIVRTANDYRRFWKSDIKSVYKRKAIKLTTGKVTEVSPDELVSLFDIALQ